MPTVRDVFFDSVYEKIQNGDDFYFLSADIGAPSLDKLRVNYPHRFINVGIAEQALVGIAAGMVLSGKKIIAYGLNPFPVTRAYDFIRCLMGEMKIPVTLCALNAGLCSAAAGYTHMATEVFGMMRTLPCVQIINLSDMTMANMLADVILENPRPRYVIFDKSIQKTIYNTNEINFTDGFTIYSQNANSEIALISYGCYVEQARQIVDNMAEQESPVDFIDIFALPVNENKLAKNLKKYKSIVTVEENALPCGLGAYILEILSDKGVFVPVRRLGVDIRNGLPEVFLMRDYARNLFGIDENSVLQALLSAKRM